MSFSRSILLSLPLLFTSCSESRAYWGAPSAPDTARARAVLIPVGESGVSGEVLFECTEAGVRVTGQLEGLSEGHHGFHVHRYGDLSDRATGASAGGHFAPEDNMHGRPGDEERHAGDLGNIVAASDGTATVDLVDTRIRLDGDDSIVGRCLVVHETRDQFTQPSGGAGARVAFGVVGIAGPATDTP